VSIRVRPPTQDGASPARSLRAIVDAMAAAEDEETALLAGLSALLAALDAEGGVLVRHGAVVASTGWGDGPPDGGATASVPVDDGHVAVVRRRGLDEHQTALLHAGAAVLDGAAALAARLAGERAAHAATDALAADLARRHRLYEDLSAIQHSISHRAPLPEVLDAIVAAVVELFGDELSAMLLATETDPEILTLAASRGVTPAYGASITLRDADAAGAAGRAYVENRLVVIQDYATSNDAVALFRDLGITAAMAAPVHEHGHPIGVVIVATYRPDRRYSETDRDLLVSLAAHASLAVADSRSVAAVAHQAMHDALTGLPNRTVFRDRLAHAVARAQRTQSPIAVMFCDLDGFKAVNDSLGHAAGDELLVALGRRLAESVRAADTAARVGGDEFAVLLEDLDDLDHPERVARRIVDVFARTLRIGGRELRPGVSVGVAVGTEDGAELVRRADVAMYRAKSERGGGVAVYEDGMHDESVDRLAFEADLGRAVERDELELDYQPIVSLADGTIAGFEALVRWRHPERGRIPPGVFVPLAEDTGQIGAIGRHVLRRACARAAAWRTVLPDAGLDTITVNLSGRELADPELPATVASALADSGLPPGCLVLEFTESDLLDDTDATIARLRELKATGVRLAVDHFGAGYSSLRYLQRFPIDLLKLAKPFVDGLAGDDKQTALVCAMLDLATNLGLGVVAEGIEQADQAAALGALGYTLGQGFHFGRPLSSDAATALLANGARAA
jgi:diguanylate cyclase (GGDEF)-like protein